MQNQDSGGTNEGQRALANNNSVAYKEKPEMGTFMREWLVSVRVRSGERGIFNRQSAQKQAAKNGRRDSNKTSVQILQ